MAGYIRVDVIHSEIPDRRFAELRLDLGSTISEIKERLYKHTGASASSMQLSMETVCPMTGKTIRVPLTGYDDDNTYLSNFNCVDGCTIYVTGPLAHSAIEDSNIKKYEMPDEVYNARTESMRVFLSQIKPPTTSNTVKEKHIPSEEEISLIKLKYPLGSRCAISGDRRGSVAYVGLRSKSSKIWIGIALDEPLGSSDGKDGKVKLFECLGERYGEFMVPEQVTIGDFPPFDPLAISEDEI